MNALAGVSTSFGLASAAGLNAYLPLLIVALTARFTNLIQLRPPYDVLTSGWVIGILVVLLTIEVFVDKVPAVDSVNDVIQTFVRPLAGAVLFAANSNVISNMHPVLALVCGLLLAGGVHAAKATARPVVTASSGGLLNPLVSLGEDIVSAALTVLAILVPIVVMFFVLFCFGLFGWWYFRRKRGRELRADS